MKTKQYTVVSRRSDFVMWRTPLWETMLNGPKNKKNPHGIYDGGFVARGKYLYKTDSYKEARAAAKWADEVAFMCQHKVVNVAKVPEMVKVSKKLWRKIFPKRRA